MFRVALLRCTLFSEGAPTCVCAYMASQVGRAAMGFFSVQHRPTPDARARLVLAHHQRGFAQAVRDERRWQDSGEREAISDWGSTYAQGEERASTIGVRLPQATRCQVTTCHAGRVLSYIPPSHPPAPLAQYAALPSILLTLLFSTPTPRPPPRAAARTSPRYRSSDVRVTFSRLVSAAARPRAWLCRRADACPSRWTCVASTIPWLRGWRTTESGLTRCGAKVQLAPVGCDPLEHPHQGPRLAPPPPIS